MITILRGTIRILFCLIIFVVGGTSIVIASFLPIQVGNYPLAYRTLILVVDLLVMATNIKVEVSDPDRLNTFRGFLFPNHVSYIDILILIEAVPSRFLAKNKVRYWPFVGQVARAIGCVFVKRNSKKSRQKARLMMKNTPLFPPIIVFPEGTRGPGNVLLPFRYGAFEIVTESSIPFLPLVIVYDQLDIVRNREESIWLAYWRLLSRKGKLVATVHVLDEQRPSPDDNPIELSIDIHQMMHEVLVQQQFDKRTEPA